MAWNQPGGQKNPWGRRPDPGGTATLDQALKSWKRRIEAWFGGGAGGGAGGDGGSLAALPILFGAIAIAVWLYTGLFQIESAERGIIQTFGRYTETRNPGWGWRWPWPISTLTRVNVSSVNSSDYRSRVLTRDVNLVELRFAVQYQFSDPVKVLFSVRDPESTLREVSESAIRELVGRTELDAILVGATRNQLTDSTKELIQRTLDAYRAGIRVTTVNLTDVQVPEAVQPSQRDANKALADQERSIKEAEAYANSILPNAQGTANRKIQDAQAYRAQVIAVAGGEAARFNSIAAAYKRSPEVTRKRLYLETVESVLGGARKVIVDSKGAGNMIYLPLDKLLERAAAETENAAAAAATRAAPSTESDTVTVDGRSRGER
jgi:membrane protease subunit HflK